MGARLLADASTVRVLHQVVLAVGGDIDDHAVASAGRTGYWAGWIGRSPSEERFVTITLSTVACERRLSCESTLRREINRASKWWCWATGEKYRRSGVKQLKLDVGGTGRSEGSNPDLRLGAFGEVNERNDSDN